MVAAAEKLMAGPDAIERVTGSKPSYSTFLRWTTYGVVAGDGPRVRLEFHKCGSKRLTTVEAVQRFVAAATAQASK